jgi:hypothetical protein
VKIKTICLSYILCSTDSNVLIDEDDHTDEGSNQDQEIEINSSSIEHLKRLSNDNQEVRHAVKKLKKNASISDVAEDEFNYTTPIAARLCRTRLPRARF